MSTAASPAGPSSDTASGRERRAGTWSPWSSRTWSASAHLALDLPVGALWGGLVVALLAASLALVPLALLGVALLAVTLALSMVGARAERARARLLLGTPPVAGPALPRTPNGWLRLLADRHAWLTVLYAVALVPLGIINATVTLTGWALVAAGLTSQAWAWLLPTHTVALGPWVLDGEPAVIVTTALAALLAAAMPQAVRLLAAIDSVLVRSLLQP